MFSGFLAQWPTVCIGLEIGGKCRSLIGDDVLMWKVDVESDGDHGSSCEVENVSQPHR